MITVCYSDGQNIEYTTKEIAEAEIGEIVFGSDFETTVDSVFSDDGKSYGAKWKVELEEQD